MNKKANINNLFNNYLYIYKKIMAVKYNTCIY